MEKTVMSPILIAAPARSGTVMMANLLHAHGAWIGPANTSKVSHVKGNVGAENTAIKNLMKSYIKDLGHTDKESALSLDASSAIDVECFRANLEADVPEDRPWLIKTSLTLDLCDVLMAAYPNARWVLLYRDIEDILESVANHPKMRRRKWDTRKLVKALRARQEHVFLKANYANKVHSGHVINSHIAARAAVEWCGFDFIHEKYTQVVKRDEWKKWAKK